MEDAKSIVKSVDSVDLTNWSDDRRKDFACTFADRVRASRYIMAETVRLALAEAQRRGFVPGSVANKVKVPCVNHDDSNWDQYGRRKREEQAAVAAERARALLAELPTLQRALAVIQPGTARKIDRRDALRDQAKAMHEEYAALSEVRMLADLDPEMTVGRLVKDLKAQAARRRELLAKIDEAALEAAELDRQVGKSLADGIPGLTEAVVEAISGVAAQCEAMEVVARRVHEKVMFGDSKEAMEILRRFEQDESCADSDTSAKIRAAVAALGVKTRRARKGAGK